MSAEWGTLKEPTLAVPAAEADPSRSVARAERSSPGAWSESLGQYGSQTWNLPGMGASAPKCGQWYPSAVCTDHGHLDLTTHSCGRRSCPDCWGLWAQEAAVRAAARLQAWRYQQPDDYRRQVAHAYVSPEEGDIMTEREFWEGRKEAAEWAERKGFKGFAVLGHPWRPTEAAWEMYEIEEPDIGIWVWLRTEFEEIREWVYWSPHYHIIGATTPDMDKATEDDDWVYRFERSVETFDGIRDKESHDDLYGLFRYLLSHVGWPEESTHQVTTWYGSLANSVFVQEATEEWQYQKPSEGVQEALKREISEVAGVVLEEEGDGSGDPETDDLGECPVDGCEGLLIDVFDVRAYLQSTDVASEVADRMQAAREWRLGLVEPPPGLKNPRSREQAEEAFEALLSNSV